MRKVFYALLILIVLALGVVLIGPSFVDWNSQKARLTDEVQKVTGRELTIDGDMSLSILPTPALSVSGVRFANMAGGSQPYMAEIGELQVNVALLPLLEGRIKIENVVLRQPKIFLERLADGRANWDLLEAGNGDSAASSQSAGDGGGQGIAGQVQVDSFTIEQGSLSYDDGQTGQSERIEDLNVKIVAEALTGPMTAKGEARVRDINTAFDVAIGRFARTGATPLKLSLSLPDAGATAQFTGSLSLHPDDVVVRGRLNGDGRSLAEAIRALGQEAAPSPVLGQSFALEGEIKSSQSQVSVSGLQLVFGATTMSGEAVANLGPPLDLHVTLASAKIDADSLLAQAQSAGTAGSASQSSSAPAEEPMASQLNLPKDIKARLELAVEGLIYNQQAVRQLRFDAFLEDGKITLGQAKALLPGGSDFSLSGMISAQADGQPGFAGRTSLASDNLRALASWLEVDLQTVPAERLRRMAFSSQIEATPKQVSLSELDLSVDLSRLTGGIVVAVRERPGLGIGLSINSLNLDAYLLESAGQSATAAESDGGTGATTGADSGLAVLDRFDANLNLRVGSLTYRGITAKDVNLDAGLKDGTLTVKGSRVGDLAGASGTLEGRFDNLASAPQAEGQVALTVKDPLRLARTFDLDADSLARLGAFDLRSGFQGTPETLDIDAVLTALNGEATAKGRIDAISSLPRVDLIVAARHPRLSDLVDAVDLAPDLRPGLGGLDVSGRVAGSAESLSISELAGQAGPLSLSGSMTIEPAAAAPLRDIAMTFALQHDDLNRLGADLGQELDLNPAIGGVDLQGSLNGQGNKFDVTDLAGTLGPVELRGAVGADLSGARPMLSANLDTGEIPLERLKPAGSESGASAAGDGQAPSPEQRWSNAPIDLSALRGFDGSLDLRASALTDQSLRMTDVVVKASLSDGLLDLQQFSAAAYKGAIKAVGKLDARATPALGGSVTAIGVETRELLSAKADFDRISGPIDVNLSVTSQGKSERALVSALQGNGTINGTVKVKITATEQAGNLALNILGTKVREVRGLVELPTTILGTFSGGEPAALTGTFKITDGVVTTQDLQLKNQRGRSETKGQASLPAWWLDSVTNVYDRSEGGEPYITVKLKGPLDTPDVKLSGARLLGQGGSSDEQPAEGQEQEQPAEQEILPLPVPDAVNPEKILKDVFKGLGG